MIVSEQLNYIKTRRFHAIFMPVIIEFSRCIRTYLSARFEIAGASVSGIVYTLIETAKLNHLDEFGCLRYLLESLPDLDHRNHPELLEFYLPWSEALPERCRLRKHRKK